MDDQKYLGKYRVRSARYKGWDYRTSAHYFITICTANKQDFFGEISLDKMIISPVGAIAHILWHEMIHHYPKELIELGEFIVMPNHVHVVLEPKEGHHLSDILKSWKTFTAKKANLILNRTGAFWQAESFDRMIRNQQELSRALEYVRNNPIKAGLKDWPWVWVRSPELPV